MKSIIEAALNRYEERGGEEAPTSEGVLSEDDEELEKILAGLTLTIKVVGCGGGGSNTISRLMEEGIRGAELVACNTDAVHLKSVHSNRKILLGLNTTRGLGAGGEPSIGRKSAEEARSQLEHVVAKSDIVFVTCGLGGGTGTGSAPMVAEMAKEHGALVVVFTTKPFRAEGPAREEAAVWGLNRLVNVADTVVTIPNDKLLEINPNMPLNAAFHVVDELLMNSIKGIIEMVTKPGLVNIDYNDLRTIMDGMGMAVVGIGTDDSDDRRAEKAVKKALDSPLLAYDISNAKGALIKVTGGPDMTLQEAETVAEEIMNRVNPGTRMIWGAAIDPEWEGKINVMMVITGVDSPDITGRAAARARIDGGGTGGAWARGGGPEGFDSVR
ncbi:MAG: cell division protein FtsZ [Thermoplasmata archaeon]|nr:MAG: cell division protein FtsZ [Thermoplasmata archaeon]